MTRQNKVKGVTKLTSLKRVMASLAVAADALPSPLIVNAL